MANLSFNLNGKWMFEQCDQEVWGYSSLDEYDTKEEAIEAGRKHFQEMREEEPEEFEEYGLDHFQVGQLQDFYPHISGNWIIDDAIEQAISECGDVAESFLNNVSRADIYKLSDALNETFRNWMKENGYTPKFYSIQNIEEVSIDGI